MSEGGASAARTGLVVLVGTLVGALANFALAAVIGRGLGPGGAGTFFAVVGAFAIASNVLELGVDTGLVRMLARYRAQGRTRDLSRAVVVAVIPVVVVGVASGFTIYLAAEPLGALLGGVADRSERVVAYQSLAPFVLAGSLLAVLLGGSRGLGQVWPLAAIQGIGVPVARLAVATVVLTAGYGVVSVLEWWAAALPIATAAAGLALLRGLRSATGTKDSTRSQGTRIVSGELWRFSAPRGVAAAVEICLEWVDVIVVAILLSPQEAGVYAIVTRLVRVGQMVEHAARVAIAPQLSAMSALGDTQGVTALYRKASFVLLALALPFYLSLMVHAPALLSIFGRDFDDGSSALRIAAGGMLLALSAGALQTVILMSGRSTWQLRNKSWALITALILLMLLVPQLGITGAAMAWVGAIIVDTVRAAFQARTLGLRFGYNRATWRLVGSGVGLFVVFGSVMATIVPGVFAPLVTAGVAGPIYAFLIWRFRSTWFA